MFNKNSKVLQQAIRSFHIYMQLPGEYFKNPVENQEAYSMWKCKQGCSKREINLRNIVILFQHRNSVAGIIKGSLKVTKKVMFIKCFIPPAP